MPSETADQDAPGHDTVTETEEPHEETSAGDKSAVADRHEGTSATESSQANGATDPEASKRRPARGDEPFEKWERDAMEKLLGEVRGHLGTDLSLAWSVRDLKLCLQWSFLLVFLRAKTSPTTSCSTPTGQYSDYMLSSCEILTTVQDSPAAHLRLRSYTFVSPRLLFDALCL
jgi:hypothetical protein